MVQPTVIPAPRSEERRQLAELVRAELTRFVGLRPTDPLPEATAFLDLGFDSLRAVDFKTVLEERLATKLRSTVIYDCPTVGSLVDFLLDSAAARPAPAAEPGAKPRPKLEELSREALIAEVERSEERALALTERAHAPIAIVGMACRFPGARTLSEFWSLQREGRDAIGPVPRGRWSTEAWYDPDPSAPGKMNVKEGGFVEGVELFDADFFNISPREARALDPQQRLLLEVAWEALENAGIAPDRLGGAPAGVFIGLRESEYFNTVGRHDVRHTELYVGTGNALSTAAGRISFTLGLTGPAISVDTACSSSLVAVHLAVQSLRRGESRLALVGGVNVLLDPLGMVSLSKGGMLSPEARCKTFAAGANGYVRSEGAGMVVLKPWSAAVADGDRVLAVILGSAVNQDGQSGGLTVPFGPAQEAVIRAALSDARVSPGEVSYVEAHGTGTALGDPIEMGAIDRVFRGRATPLPVGTIKTNIGHLETAAGIAGLVRTVLALGEATIPGILHLKTKSPHIPWSEICTTVPERAEPWTPSGARRIAGISSFGFSGTNAHLIVAEAPADARPDLPPAEDVMFLSAKSEAALAELLRTRAEELPRLADARFPDACYTSRVGRAEHEHRLAVTAADLGDLKKRLDRAQAGAELPGVFRGRAPGDPPPLAFLYTGQGAQHAGMGQDLSRVSPVFRRALEEAEAALAPHLPGALFDRLWGDQSAELSETHWAQPALFAIEVALGALWRSYGITPSIVLGHSVGELAAAVTAGLLSLEDGARLVATRGLAMTEHCPPGAMITVFGTEEVVAPMVRAQGPAAAISGYNGPANLTVAGTSAALEEISAALAQAGVSTRKVVASRAFHTPQMAAMVPQFQRALDGVRLGVPQVDLISTAFPEDGAAAFADPTYFARQILAPVRFAPALSALYQRGYRTFVELGPRPTLCTLGKEVLGDPAVTFLPTLRPGRDAESQILECASQLWVRGAALDGQRFKSEGRRRVALSSYPFQRRRYWYESASEARGSSGAVHPLLGGRLRSPALDPARVEHQSAISAEAPGWLADHAVEGQALFPAAGYVELGLAALAERQGAAGLSLSNLRILAPLPLGVASVELSTATVPSGAALRVEIATLSTEEARWTTHATGLLEAVELRPRRLDLAALSASTSTVVDVAGLYDNLRALGLEYGPAFRGIERLWLQGPGASVAFAKIRLPEAAGTGEGYLLHPALLDACFQVSAALLRSEGHEGRALPVAIERVSRYGQPGPSVVCQLSRRETSSQRSIVIDVVVADPSGEVVAEVLGLELLRVDSEQVDGRALLERWSYVTEWRSAPAVEAQRRGLIWLLPDEGGVGAALAAELTARGAEVLSQAARPGLAPTAIVVSATLDARGGDAKRALAPLLALSRLEWGEAGPRVYVLSASSSASGPAAIAGFLASWAAEGSALRPTRLELEAQPERADLALVATEVLADDLEEAVQLIQGERRVLRLVRGLGHPYPALADRWPEGSWQIRTSAYGQLGNLRFVPLVRRAPGPGEVEVELSASALNFRDVLHALGMLEAFSRAYGVTRAEEQPFGFDAVGRISAAGEGTAFSPGQRVMLLGLGAAASHLTVDARQVAIAPEQLSDADVAALPTAYLTALLGLLRLARLSPGESVLIHGAAGGVGQAAVAVAQRARAKIFATAHPKKHAFLRSLGLSDVYSSRDLGFEEAISRATQGRGVDVVLNSLSGPALDASLRLLARGGRFVEIGKLGILSAEEVQARRPDARYLPFDLGESARRDPALLGGLFAELNAGLREGSLSRLPTSVYSALDAVSAFSLVARSGHLGKVVLSHRSPLRPERTTLITGGLGALGLVAAKALVAAGAPKLALFGRNAPGPEAQATIAALEAEGATVQVLQGDVSSREELGRALAALPDLGGVIHAAGILDDGAARSLDGERLGKVLAPKLEGAQHLRALLADRSLDFFVSYSSASAVFGSAGQVAYAAANAALAAEMGAERRLGRPGLALAFGAWGEQGMAARLPEPLKRRLREGGLREIAPAEGAAVLLAALERGSGAAELALLPIHWPRFLARPGALDGPLYESFRGAATPKQPRGPGAAALRARLAAAEAGERPEIIADLLATELAAVIGLSSKTEVDTSRKLSTMGVDSLLAVDLRNRLELALGHKLPASLLFDHPTIDELALHLSRALDQGPARPAAPAPALPDASAENEALSEEELGRRLEAQLSRLGR